MPFEPQATALALTAMLEGLWLRLMMGTEDITREIGAAGRHGISVVGVSRSTIRGAAPRLPPCRGSSS